MNNYNIYIDPTLLAKEVSFKMSCSSGNGGQNVNRVATKAMLLFEVDNSNIFSDKQKEIIKTKLKNRTNKDGFIFIINQESRSAIKNKKAAVQVLLNLIQKALEPKKVRKKMRIPRSINEKRIANKKQNSEKKELRKKIF